MKIVNLEACFDTATKENLMYVGVKIQMEGFNAPEVIINQRSNFEKKLEYYKKAYNDDLTLKVNSGIKIIGFTYGNSFKDIEEDLLG